jgi:hypothetical protein
MGLLDDISEALPNFLPDDPQQRQAAKMGLLSLGASMMGARTQNFGRALGEGMQGGVSGYANAYEMANKTAMQQAQLKLLQNQDARTQQMMSMGRQLFGGGDTPTGTISGMPASQGATGGGMPVGGTMGGNPLVRPVPMSPAAPPQQEGQSGGFMRNMTPDQAVGWQMMGGQDLLPALKFAKEGIPREQGKAYIDPYTGKTTSYAKLDSGQVQNDDGSVSNAPGYTDAAAVNAAALASATERAKANLTPLPIGYKLPDGRPIGGTVGSYIGGAPLPPSPVSVSSPAFQGSDVLSQLSPQARAAILADAKGGDGKFSINMQMPAGNRVSGAVDLNASGMQEPSVSGAPLLQSDTEAAQEAARVKLINEPILGDANSAFKDLRARGESLSGKLANSQALLQRITQSREALTRFQAGGGSEARAALAEAAQAIPGMPRGIVDGIAGGDLSAVQEFQKYSAQEAMETMKDSLAGDGGGASKGNRLSMDLFVKNNPKITTDPRATEKIFNFITGQHNQLVAEHDALTGYITDPKTKKDGLAFDNFWMHKQIDSGNVKPEMVTGSAKGTLPASPVKPKGAPLTGQVVQGFKFKGGDPSNQKNWEKQ